MQVSGLSKNYYYVNNPIWVSIKTESIVLATVDTSENFTNTPFEFRFLPINGKITFDAAVIAKGLMEFTSFNPNIFNGVSDENLIKKITFKFEGTDENQMPFTELITKNFLRGGFIDGYNTNAYNNLILKESDLIPRWTGYPNRKYKIQEDDIIVQSIIPDSETDLLQNISCDSLYMAFLNSKGGYSFWLFEKYTTSLNSEKSEIVKRMYGFDGLGSDIEYNISVESRVPRRYYGLIRALSKSPEVYAYKLNDVFDSTNIPEWKKIHSQSILFDTKSHEDVERINLDFSCEFSENSSMIW